MLVVMLWVRLRLVCVVSVMLWLVSLFLVLKLLLRFVRFRLVVLVLRLIVLRLRLLLVVSVSVWLVGWFSVRMVRLLVECRFSELLVSSMLLF